MTAPGILAVDVLLHRFFARTKPSPASDNRPQKGAETKDRKLTSNTDAARGTEVTIDGARSSAETGHCEQSAGDRISVASPHSSYPPDRSQLGCRLDTVIVPARRDTCQSIFLTGHKRHHTQISTDRLSQIGHIASCQAAPASEITDFLPVKRVLSCCDRRYALPFPEPPEDLPMADSGRLRALNTRHRHNCLILWAGHMNRDDRGGRHTRRGKAFYRRVRALTAAARMSGLPRMQDKCRTQIFRDWAIHRREDDVILNN